MKPNTLLTLCLAYANRLKYKHLFFIIAGLFLLDLVIPDMIPMVDEIILGLLAILLANLKQDKPQEEEVIIEGEVIDRDDST